MDDLNPLPGAAPGAEKKPRGRPFAPGVSGNPKGRPKGSRNRATIIVEALREGEAEALTRKLVEQALAGDWAALRMCVKRLWAPRRGRRVEVDLPELGAGGAATASQAVLTACAAGTLSPREASDVMGLIRKHFQTLKVSELEAKVAELEARRRARCPVSRAIESSSARPLGHEPRSRAQLRWQLIVRHPRIAESRNEPTEELNDVVKGEAEGVPTSLRQK